MSAKKRDHCFVPGDRRYGWGLQCDVKMPVVEAGEIVSACCGAPPEMHPRTSDPKHASDCLAYVKGDGCDCWVSAARPSSPKEGQE
jgi:hypothetical protein